MMDKKKTKVITTKPSNLNKDSVEILWHDLWLSLWVPCTKLRGPTKIFGVSLSHNYLLKRGLITFFFQ